MLETEETPGSVPRNGGIANGRERKKVASALEIRLKQGFVCDNCL